MPNWIYNTLELVGPKEKINEFYANCQRQWENQTDRQNKAIDWFDGFLELPQEMPNDPELDLKPVSPDFVNDDSKQPAWYNFENNWYEYNLKHLGIKWSVNSLTQEPIGPLAINDQQSEFVLDFQTPWSPLNQNALQTLAAKYNVRLVLSSYDWDNNQSYCVQVATKDYYDYADEFFAMEDYPEAPPELEDENCPQAIIDQYDELYDQWRADKEAELQAELNELQVKLMTKFKHHQNKKHQNHSRSK